MGIKSGSGEELPKRFANCTTTMKKLDLIRTHSNCDAAMQIYIAEAVLRFCVDSVA